MNSYDSPTRQNSDEQLQEQPLNFSTNSTHDITMSTTTTLWKDSGQEKFNFDGRSNAATTGITSTSVPIQSPTPTPRPLFTYQPSIFMTPGLLPSPYMSSFAAAAAMSAAMNVAVHRLPHQL
uniref:Uncharacterized protein n=1 Tax=Setaria digitata TaxID=48799 RepID=A0A915PMP9_9BILA